MGSHIKIEFAGQLAFDPEMHYTPGGKAVTLLKVAHNRKWGDIDEVTWLRITVWEAKAESCNTWLKKGSKVFIEGFLKPDPTTGGPTIWYTKETNEARASYEVTAYNVVFLGDLSDGGSERAVEGFDKPADDAPVALD